MCIFVLKFLISEIDGELPEETQIRFDLAIQRLQTDIKLVNIRSQRYENAHQDIDTLMNDEIDKIASNPYSNKMKEIWTKEEIKSIKISEPEWDYGEGGLRSNDQCQNKFDAKKEPKKQLR